MKRFYIVFFLAVSCLFCGCDNGAPAGAPGSARGSGGRERRQGEAAPPAAPSGESGSGGSRSEHPGNAGAENENNSGEDGGAEGKKSGDAGEGRQGSDGGSGSGSGGGGNNNGDQPSGGGGSDAADGTGSDGRGGRAAGDASEIPEDWLGSVKKPPEPGERRLWSMLTEDIRQLAAARSITFSPLGSEGTSLEKRGPVYRFSGRCVVVDNDGRRRACAFSGEMSANNYDTDITAIRFTAPGRE